LNAPQGKPLLDLRKYDSEGEIVRYTEQLGSIVVETGAIRMNNKNALFMDRKKPSLTPPLLTGKYMVYWPRLELPSAGPLETSIFSSEYGIITTKKSFDGSVWRDFIPNNSPEDTLPALPSSTNDDVWKYISDVTDKLVLHNQIPVARFKLESGRYVLDAPPILRDLIPIPYPWTAFRQLDSRLAVQAQDVIISTTPQLVPSLTLSVSPIPPVPVELRQKGTAEIYVANTGPDTYGFLKPSDVLGSYLPAPLSTVGMPTQHMQAFKMLVDGLSTTEQIGFGVSFDDVYDITASGWQRRISENIVVDEEPIFWAQSAEMHSPETDAPTSTEPMGQATPTDTSDITSISSVKQDNVMNYSSFLASYAPGLSYIQPLGPVVQGPIPQSFLNWIRITYLFSKGSVRLKVVPTPPAAASRLSSYSSASIVPFTGSIESPGYINNNPPVDLREVVKLTAYANSLASTASVAQDVSSTPMDVIVPYYSDSPVTFNVFSDILTDNSYSTVLLRSPSPGDVFISAGRDFELKFPMPCPALVPDLWAVVSTTDAAKIIFGDTTPVGWWAWMMGLMTSPVNTLQTTLSRWYQYVAIASGFYNNFVLPGTFVKYGQYYV
jgi:hypothetical protein